MPAFRLEPSLYQQLLDLPEHQVGEIIGGQLHVHSRPSGPHGQVSIGVMSDTYLPFQRGNGGPGGWWIMPEPELHLIRDVEVVVPDVAGWRKERMPQVPQGHRFEVVPDWVCEVLSPTTARRDRGVKLALYARYGVAFCWLIDPGVQTLEVLTLVQGRWQLAGVHGGADRVQVPPFEAVTMDLSGWWLAEE
ncbi:MAG: Uma2 family endonuclease [Magnetococcales bacterium]|nr:Uma2 family endonuclease [Magnetococcales bacterium]